MCRTHIHGDCCKIVNVIWHWDFFCIPLTPMYSYFFSVRLKSMKTSTIQRLKTREIFEIENHFKFSDVEIFSESMDFFCFFLFEKKKCYELFWVICICFGCTCISKFLEWKDIYYYFGLWTKANDKNNKHNCTNICSNFVLVAGRCPNFISPFFLYWAIDSCIHKVQRTHCQANSALHLMCWYRIICIISA